MYMVFAAKALGFNGCIRLCLAIHADADIEGESAAKEYPLLHHAAPDCQSMNQCMRSCSVGTDPSFNLVCGR